MKITIRRVIASLAAIVATGAIVNAQSEFDIEPEEAYSYDSPSDGYVVNADDSAAEALRLLIEQESDETTGEPKRVEMQGYRIGIFFDNSATARLRATEVVQQCDSLLGDLKTTMSYDNPYFKVSTGYCLSQEEAVMQLHRVQQHFPRAYLMREKIAPKDIVEAHKQELAEAARLDSLIVLDTLFVEE